MLTWSIEEWIPKNWLKNPRYNKIKFIDEDIRCIVRQRESQTQNIVPMRHLKFTDWIILTFSCRSWQTLLSQTSTEVRNIALPIRLKYLSSVRCGFTKHTPHFINSALGYTCYWKASRVNATPTCEHDTIDTTLHIYGNAIFFVTNIYLYYYNMKTEAHSLPYRKLLVQDYKDTAHCQLNNYDRPAPLGSVLFLKQAHNQYPVSSSHGR